MASASVPRSWDYGIGLNIDVSDLDLRKLSRFLNGEIRKIERVKATALKRAGSIVKRQLLSAVKGRGTGAKIAPTEPKSRLRNLLHGRGTAGFGAEGISSAQSIRIQTYGDHAVAIGWWNLKHRDRIARYQSGMLSKAWHGAQLRDDTWRHYAYMRIFKARPALGRRGPHGGKRYKIPLAYDQPDRPIVEPIQQNAQDNLGDWIEGALNSMLKRGRAGDLAAAALGTYLKDGEDFR